jgi:hypothetical protein
MNSVSIKTAILVFVLVILSLPLLASIIVNPYSYLSKPPIETIITATPDKEKYDRNEIITFNVTITLDTLKIEKDRQYKIIVGNLADILVSSQLMKSNVKSSYDMSFEQNVVNIAFTVQMLQDDTPPYIKVEMMRLANTNSTIFKQYRNYQIDQYEKIFITSSKYAATK